LGSACTLSPLLSVTDAVTNPQTVYAFLRGKKRQGFCDDCVEKHAGVDRHEVNTITSTLALFPQEFTRSRQTCPQGCKRAQELRVRRVPLRQFLGDGQTQAIRRQPSRPIPLRHQHVPDFVVADREIAPPFLCSPDPAPPVLTRMDRPLRYAASAPAPSPCATSTSPILLWLIERSRRHSVFPESGCVSSSAISNARRKLRIAESRLPRSLFRSPIKV
jgi:hypothetical protein